MGRTFSNRIDGDDIRFYYNFPCEYVSVGFNLTCKRFESPYLKPTWYVFSMQVIDYNFLVRCIEKLLLLSTQYLLKLI